MQIINNATGKQIGVVYSKGKTIKVKFIKPISRKLFFEIFPASAADFVYNKSLIKEAEIKGFHINIEGF